MPITTYVAQGVPVKKPAVSLRKSLSLREKLSMLAQVSRLASRMCHFI